MVGFPKLFLVQICIWCSAAKFQTAVKWAARPKIDGFVVSKKIAVFYVVFPSYCVNNAMLITDARKRACKLITFKSVYGAIIACLYYAMRGMQLITNVISIKEDIKSVKDTHEIIKKTLLEQQQFLEKLRRENSASNVIITGIPKTIAINDAPTDEAEAKLEHVCC